MSGYAFFSRIADIDQWVGNLFYRRVQPPIISAMEYSELEFWSEWHDRIEKQVEDSVKDAKGGGSKK